MAKKRLIIDIGHGINTYPPSKGVPEMAEFEFNNAVGKLAKPMLEEQGFEVLLSQPFDSNEVSLSNRVKYINEEHKKNKIECIISIHADYNNNPDVKGHWVFYWHSSSNSKRLATIWDKYGKELPNTNRGILESKLGIWTNFMILRDTTPPAILIEHGFMSNKDDLKLLMSDEFRKKCAIAITKTTCEYCNIEYIEPKPKQLYRIRKSWEDAKSQIGAYHNLDTAKSIVDNNEGYNVYDENGELIYPERRNIMQLTYSRILKKGLRGEDIKQLQNTLHMLGYDIGKSGADGIAGNMTDLAIRAFQRDNKLVVDGLVGKASISKLNELLSNGNTKPPIQEKYKHYKSGVTDVVEIDPLELKISVQDKPANKINLPNMVTSGYQWHHANGVTYPLGILVSEGKVISNRQPHGKPAGTLIVYKDGIVKVKELLNINGEKNVWFAVSGCSVLPTIQMTSAGFVGAYSDIGRSANRPLIGYNPTKKKIVIAVRSACSINTGQTVLKNLGCSVGVTLDAGGSTLLKVDGKLLQSTTRRLYSVITW